ncbi:MAG: helicase C-terminal domain-containing protein, partial [Floccifex sp.]
YMSATLADDSVFVSTIGLKKEDIIKVITPEKANDIGERLILFPQSLNPMIDENEIRERIKELSEKYNVSVLVNSFSKANLWSPYADQILSSRNENIEQGIRAIREGKGNCLTVFVNKYDGIDLPDDMCRILVIDDLPNLQSEYDKILYSFDPDNKQLLKRQIQKIEQGMGRGVRSNSDYCVVIFMGNKLSDTLITMQGKRYFSNATLAQFKLSEEIWTQILHNNNSPSLEDIISIADYSLKRDEEWVNMCRGALSGVIYERTVSIDKVVTVLRNAFENAKCGQFKAAADEIDLFKNKVDDSSKAFLMQMVAEYTNFIDPLKAQDIQLSAKKINPSLLSPISGYQHSKLLNTSKQAEYIESFLIKKRIEKNQLLIRVNSILEELSFNGVSAAMFEESLNEIANYIGYSSSRPEKENGEGPDNLWCLGNGHYLVIECKNCTTTNTICKSDCNQLNGSIQWFETEYKGNGFVCTPIMIHNSNIFNSDCFPDEDVRIITPKKLDDLKQAIKCFTQAFVTNSTTDNKKVNELLGYYKLSTESIVNAYSVSFEKIK